MTNIYGLIESAFAEAQAAPVSIISPEYLTTAELLEAARVRPRDTVEADPVAIWIKNDEKLVQFGTLGNFSMITGKAKSKKTFALCLAVANAIDGNHFNAGPFSCSLPKNKRRVLYFDTEQGKYRVWKALNRVCKMAGVADPPDVEYFDLRGYDTHQRVDVISYALNEGNPDKNIGLVIVDGCRDLVHDFNDPKDATKLATHFLQWTATNNLHLITVLHQNKADTNARGHVGSELTNKAETVISVEVDSKDKAVSIVKPEQTRAEGFTGFAFTINEDGLPELLPDYELSGKAGGLKKQYNPFDYMPDTHHAILNKAFRDGPIYGRDDCLQRLKIEWQGNDVRLGDSKAKEYMAYYQKMGWLSNTAEPGKKAVYSYHGIVGGVTGVGSLSPYK